MFRYSANCMSMYCGLDLCKLVGTMHHQFGWSKVGPQDKLMLCYINVGKVAQSSHPFQNCHNIGHNKQLISVYQPNEQWPSTGLLPRNLRTIRKDQ